MQIPRASHATTGSKDNEVFVAGGYNEEEGLLNSAEMYDINADMWKKLSNMATKRKNLSLCVMVERYLYAIGGVIETNKPETDLIEVLDISNPTLLQQWSQLLIKGSIPLQKAGIIELSKDKLLIFGGKSEGRKLESAYILNTSDLTLSLHGKLESPEVFNNRSDYRRFSHCLYVTAGRSIGTTHIYSLKEDRWILMNKDKYLLKYGME